MARSQHTCSKDKFPSIHEIASLVLEDFTEDFFVRLLLLRRQYTPENVVQDYGILWVNMMRIAGERFKRTRLIQTDKYVVAVEVEMVIPVDDPREPCYESETVELLREIQARAEKGDVTWLSQNGKVYSAMEPV